MAENDPKGWGVKRTHSVEKIISRTAAGYHKSLVTDYAAAVAAAWAFRKEEEEEEKKGVGTNC